MIPEPPQNRPDMAVDLTRWNRAGLGRVQYVDGDAATWLEELRIALLGLYLRGAPPERRTPEAWRHFFSSELFEERDNASEEAARLAALAVRRAEAEQFLQWSELLPVFPEKLETALRRNLRLLEQYDGSARDHGWEIMRAFARAAHVLLGHVDAYANEGYLRTATQWENVRRLAAMVNYQPAPPASVTTEVALILDPDKGPAEIGRGLAMKYAPPEGGPPLIFETLTPLQAHPELNAARVVGWDRDERELDPEVATVWVAPEKAVLAQGDLAVLFDEASETAEATALESVTRDEDAGTADIKLSPEPTNTVLFADAVLFAEPAQVLEPLPISVAGILAAKVDDIALFTAGGLVQIDLGDGSFGYGEVLSVKNGVVSIVTDESLSGEIELAPMTPIAIDRQGSARFVQSATEQTAVFKVGGAFVERTQDGTTITSDQAVDSGTVKADGDFITYRISAAQAIRNGYVPTGNFVKAEVLLDFPEVIIGLPPAPSETVLFPGKPPKGMEAGEWFAARQDSTLKALQVVGVRTTPDGFYIQFHDTPPSLTAEFHGPMGQTLRPIDHDRSRVDVVTAGSVELTGLSDAARALLKPGHTIVIDRDRAGVRRFARAEITSIADGADGVLVGFDSDEDFTGWEAGWTSIRCNVVQVSHGETKGGKTLGSGDAERRRQSFPFDVKKVSFIPSTVAEAGVIPDIDVAVDGVVWPYRDYIDPTSEDEQAWSSTLTEDGGLRIHFRQRLPSGLDNARIARHRIGVGAQGSGVPALSFVKPMKKHRFVTAIVQPFATAGGADREPVSSIRTAAPARLVANGRAVSLSDFERLCRRHASVWQARAREVIGAGAAPRVRITIVPANGGGISEIEQDLTEYILARALPGVEVELEGYVSLPIAVSAKVMVDTAAYDKSEVQAAAEAALASEFSLEQRAIGQTLYIAEVMAALERVEGAEANTITLFSPAVGAPTPARIAEIGGAPAAIVPTESQVAHVTEIAIAPEALL